ncbi:MAG: DUF4405 domain-containing protein [bacterium]
MTKTIKKITVDVINFITLSISAFIGILIQANYHMAHKADTFLVYGFDRGFWNNLHVISTALFVIGLIYHIVLNFPAIKTMFKPRKKHLPKGFGISRILILVMVVTSLSGIISFIFNIAGEYQIRFHFLEIHDKLGIILAVIFLIHFAQHFKWMLKVIRKSVIDNS